MTEPEKFETEPDPPVVAVEIEVWARLMTVLYKEGENVNLCGLNDMIQVSDQQWIFSSAVKMEAASLLMGNNS